MDSNNIDSLLNQIIIHKILPELLITDKSPSGILSPSDSSLLYLIYHLPRLRSYSYLLTNEAFGGIGNFTNSFSFDRIEKIKKKKHKNKPKQILDNGELSKIVCYASKSIEINELITV